MATTDEKKSSDWVARVVAVLGLVLALCSLGLQYTVFKTNKAFQQRQNAIQQYQNAPLLKFEDASISTTHPILLTPGPGRDAALAQHKQIHETPRWLDYRGLVRNVGDRTVKVWKALLCVRKEGTKACSSYGLAQDVYLEPGETLDVSFDCRTRPMIDPREEDCFYGIPKMDILIVVRVAWVDGEIVSLEHPLVGFDGDEAIFSVELRG